MKVEIVGMNEQRAVIEVTDGLAHVRIAVDVVDPAHAILREMIRRATFEIGHLRSKEMMKSFEERAR